MKVSYNWLQDCVMGKLPTPEKVAEALTMHAFEVEGVEQKGDDWVLDVDVLPNRAHDSLSHIGIARELGVLFDLEAGLPNLWKVKADNLIQTTNFVSLSVEDAKLVRRAMKRLVVDVKVGESPDWLKKRLLALGQRSINTVVDATNYITLETGQPVHAFDFDKLAGIKKEIAVRRARSGEKVTTLDGDEYTLTEEDLVIADGENALDIAGIKGGANSGIDEKTTKVVLSVCNFDPVTIRKTSVRLGLKTDASKRFENEITPELAGMAMERLSGLVQELSGGCVATDTLDVYPRRPNNYRVGLSVERVNKILGTKLSESDVTKILDRFGFSYEKIENPIAKVLELAPTFVDTPYQYGASVSFDCPKVFDCGSFINYLYVQSGIALPRMVQDQFAFMDALEAAEAKPGDLVFSSTGSDGKTEHIESLGVDQVRQTKQTMEFMPGMKFEQSVDHAGLYLGDGKVIHASGIEKGEGKVVIEDIASSDYYFKKIVGYRRVPGADEWRFVVTAPHERLDLRLEEDVIEEIGRVYGYENIKPAPISEKLTPEINKTFYYAQKVRDILVGEGFSEVMTYSFVEKGEVELRNPLADDKKYLRASLVPGLTAALAHNEKYKDLLGLEKVKIFEIGTVFSGDEEHLSLGLAGSGAREALDRLSKELGAKIGGGGEIIEVNLSEVIEKLPEPQSYDFEQKVYDTRPTDSSGRISYKPISPYPFALRDVALWVPSEVESQKVLKSIKDEAGEGLVRIDLFDEYKKEDKVSYAFHLVFQSHEKTLSEDEIHAVMEKIYAAVKEKGWEVR